MGKAKKPKPKAKKKAKKKARRVPPDYPLVPYGRLILNGVEFEDSADFIEAVHDFERVHNAMRGQFEYDLERMREQMRRLEQEISRQNRRINNS